MKPALKKRAQDEELYNCKFLNPMPKEELFKYLSANASIGLMILDNIPAFYYGTSPNKFFDYLTLGLPVLNNYPGWLAEIISKNKCGVSIKPGDPDLFAETLVKLNEDSRLLLKMGKNARTLAINKFARDKLSDQFNSFLVKNAI